MPKTDKMMRNYKSLEDERKKREKERVPFKTFEFRLVIFAITFLIMAFESDSPGTFLTLILVSATLIALLIWRIYKRRKVNYNETPFLDANPRKPEEAKRAKYQAPAENRYIEPDGDYVKSNSFTDYSDNIVDSWDIKDEKPPWEL